MKSNILCILKQMFGSNENKYLPNPYDLMIVAGESSLVLTSDQGIGGLWNILDFDPCSGSTSECLAEMKTLLDEHLDEAYDAVIFPLDEDNVFLLNMTDGINGSLCNEDSKYYKQFIDDKLDVFYPVIKMFVEKNSSNKTVGIIIYYGGGTGIGHSHLSELLMNDGFRCVIEGSRPPFLFKESLSESLAIKGIGEYEVFDNKPYMDMTLGEYEDSGARQHFSAMKNRLRERMNKYINTSQGGLIMKNLLLSAAIGDIGGEPYEFGGRTKNYEDVNLLFPQNTYTDDTVCTFACAEALLKNLDMAKTLWNRCRADFNRGFGGRFAKWLMAKKVMPPYNSYGNGSGMRVSAAGFMAKSVDECIDLATKTALPTHNHPEGIKGAVATALAIYYGMEGMNKDFIRENVLDKYYPDWSNLSYAEIKPGYGFDETCQQTIPAAIICFLESKDYVDCLKLAISLGGDADTLAAIAGPMAYAFYREIPEELIENAKAKLPKWMLDLNDEFDNFVTDINNYNVSNVPKELLTMMHGQIHTLIDLLKELNKKTPIKNCEDAKARLTKIVERNVRYGDEYAFMAMRTIWCLISGYEQNGTSVDIEKLEKDMFSFHDKFFRNKSVETILYSYSACKMIKYVQFLNEFRRYKSYKEIRKDLDSIPVSACSENDTQYYFSFYTGTLNAVWILLSEEWEHLTIDGKLDNELLDKIALGRFENMVKEYGLRETISVAYGDVGCHPNLQAPRVRNEGIIWGPIYRINGANIEKGCSDFKHWPYTSTSFEMKFAHKILEKDKNYMCADSDWRGGLYLPISDYTLPVYSLYEGKMHFDSEEEKIKFIEEHKADKNAN